jgi:hypothetical protein
LPRSMCRAALDASKRCNGCIRARVATLRGRAVCQLSNWILGFIVLDQYSQAGHADRNLTVRTKAGKQLQIFAGTIRWPETRCSDCLIIATTANHTRFKSGTRNRNSINDTFQFVSAGHNHRCKAKSTARQAFIRHT